MLQHRFDVRRRLLFVEPEAELSEDDFRKLAKAVDGFIRMHGDLNGVVIHAEDFPGWEDFGALVEHLTFIRQHHRQVAKVALVGDDRVMKLVPHIVGHFVAAETRHFPAGELDAATEWAAAP
ncbi:SpoIIAA family protein [Lentisalinibacter sediminis]|uniref:STAS/SEC14 domain-containing protein n=1 Tax=Lentisalinibacter sediminis TaxID=2992237 RepID=UPI003862EE8F